jgi:hypothetical protein
VATVQAERSSAEAEPAGLKANAIGFLGALVGAQGESPLVGGGAHDGG